MSEITLATLVVRVQDVISSPVEQDLVMMDIARGKYYVLRGAGAEIWSRLEQPVRVADLCAQLQQVYAVDAPTCEADVLTVLNDMAVHRLIESRA